MDSPLDKAPLRAANRTWIDWSAFAAAAVVLVAFRLHAFDLPLEADECNYAYIGGRLLSGDRMYVDVWDHQPFGVFVLFAGVIALFGDAPGVFRWLAVAFSLASLFFVFALLRRVSNRGAAFSGAILFAMASSDPGTAGEGCNREIYMATLILAAWYFVLRRRETSKGDVFLAGCALALASAIKTIVAVQWFFLAGWIAVAFALRPIRTSSEAKASAAGQSNPQGTAPSRSRFGSEHVAESVTDDTGVSPGAGGRSRARRTAGLLILFALGPLLLWGGTLAYFAATGRLSEFIDAVFRFNLSYSEASEGFLARFAHFFAPQRHPFIFDSALPLWVGGIGATLWLLMEAAVRRRREAMAILLLVVGAYITVCLPARFWPHYYYLLVPVLAIAVSMGVGRLVDWIRRLSRRPLPYTRSVTDRTAPSSAWPEGHGSDQTTSLECAQANRVAGSLVCHILASTLFVVFPILLLITEYRDYLSQPPFGITVKRYNSRDFWGRAQGENVARVTDPDDEIFVFGNDTEIYYYSQRRCASRYTMITGLQSGYAGADRRREILIAELRERLPRLIVVLFDEKPFEEWLVFLREYYGEPAGWDYHDSSRKAIMFVLARKDQPIAEINWDWDRSQVGGWMLGEKP